MPSNEKLTNPAFLIFTNMFLQQERVTIVHCHEDGRSHTVNSRFLEPEDSDTLSIEDLKVGNTLLWRVKKKKNTQQP